MGHCIPGKRKEGDKDTVISPWSYFVGGTFVQRF